MNKIRFDILTSLPDCFDSMLTTGIIRIATDRKIADIHIHNLHKYSQDKYGHIDDTPYGGGAGMLIMCEPVFECAEKLMQERKYDEVIYVTADGGRYNQTAANEISLMSNIMIICGRYKGIDQRIRDILVSREISIGDFVLTGGELPAMIIMDSVIRLIPGAISDSESALEDSFQDGFLEPPNYTRPEMFRGHKIPDVLLSGKHEEIKKWRIEQSIDKTKRLRPDLLDD